MRRKPREVRWTQFYRKVNKKGVNLSEKVQKNKTRVDKTQRAYTGASLEVINAKRQASQQQAAAAAESARVKAIKKREAKAQEKKDAKKQQSQKISSGAVIPKVQKRPVNKQ